MNIKPIETVYNGYRFRSRLEARWAVLFDSGDIKYEYEPEGFELEDGTRYLPDFYLPDYDWYVEVKPPRDGAIEEIRKASRFVKGNMTALLILGNIPPKVDIDAYHYSVIYFHNFHNRLLLERALLEPIKDKNGKSYNKLIFNNGYYVDSACFHVLFEDTDSVIANEIMKVAITDSLSAIHDKDMYKKYSKSDFSYCNTWERDRVRFVNSCYEKSRQSRFEHGERP